MSLKCFYLGFILFLQLSLKVSVCILVVIRLKFSILLDIQNIHWSNVKIIPGEVNCILILKVAFDTYYFWKDWSLFILFINFWANPFKEGDIGGIFSTFIRTFVSIIWCFTTKVTYQVKTRLIINRKLYFSAFESDFEH